ncbi:unnamed protein product [Acanthosepion pharaonis]|uniref:Uncharacterized protein n=1 Tax=Acanthosepion pharaonis TaxID=158019 RepID=A0A812C5S3_ACAPH|nr:unnamed protein product [Sepia pharaonis]
MKWYQFLFFDSKKRVKSCILNMEHECKWKSVSLIGIWITIHLLYCWLSEDAILILMVSSKTKLTTVTGVTLLFSISEMVILATIVRIIFPKQEKALVEGIAIIYLSHFFATFLLNFILINVGMQGNHIVFVLEPLVTLVVSNICIGEPLKIVLSAAVVALTIGAAGVRMSFGDAEMLIDRSAVLDISLILLLSCRNIVLKHIYTMSGQIKTQWRLSVGTILAVSVVMLVAMLSLFEFSWGAALSKALLSWTLHASYTAITWTVLLKQFSPLSVAIISISGQFLIDSFVRMPLYAMQDVMMWTALIFFLAGLTFYYFYSRNSLAYERTLSFNEMYTRLEFVLFLTIILTLFFYTLPPKVSPRDIKNIQYLRLDLLLQKFLRTSQVSS